MVSFSKGTPKQILVSTDGDKPLIGESLRKTTTTTAAARQGFFRDARRGMAVPGADAARCDVPGCVSAALCSEKGYN